MPPRRRKPKSTKPTQRAARKRKSRRNHSKPALAKDPFARARWVSFKYKIPLDWVRLDFDTMDAGAYEAHALYVTWEMLRAYDTRNLREDREEREKEFARELLESGDPRIQDSIERCLIANEKTEPFGYQPRPWRELIRENSLAMIERLCDGTEMLKRSHFRRVQILPAKEVKHHRRGSAYPISQVEVVRVRCKQCKLVLELPIEDATPLFQTGYCPFCPQALHARPSLENEPFMLLWRALRRFKELEKNYKVEFLIFAIDD